MALSTTNASSADQATGGRVIVTGSARPARTVGGLKETRVASPIHLTEHRVDRAHDGDDVGDLVAGNDVREHREVRERRATPLQAVGLGPPVADEVAADLAARPLDPRVPLTLGYAHLPHGLHPGSRRDRPRGEAVERLADDPDRLAELDHPHAG